MTYDAAIIGGGLAGCSAAIQLARRGHCVVLFEKLRYPHDKLCGEFLSVEVQAMFERLGVLGAVRLAGAHPIRQALVTTMDGAAFRHDLPGTALGLSRYRLDALLAEHARACGATVRDGVAVRSVAGSLDDGFTLETDAGTVAARVVLGAYGKRSTLDRHLGRSFLKERSPYVAFKAHFSGAALPGVIELHSFEGGYCGLSHVEGERINACWITRDEVLKGAGGDPEAMIDGPMQRNPALARRLGAMTRVSDRFCAVAQVSFAPKAAFAGDVCMVGDTAGMIAPMCGDGMAMALRAAELAAPRAAAFLEEEAPAAAFRDGYRAAWRGEFGLRMRLGRWMHHAYCRPSVARVAVAACRRVPAAGRWLMHKTRSVPGA
ncbi:MAG: FAD-dependent oxidoreductase [Rhodothermales bacterium]|nr:FAD-dependent oxidoreductase [Rhodothermales bacterium]